MDNTKIAIEIFDDCANEYQDKFMALDLYHDSFDLFCATIEQENANILKLGCGPGNITKYLLKKRQDFHILGTDLSEKMIQLAKKNNPSAEFQICDCRNIHQITKKYDGVMCGFCLPYLSKKEAIKLITDVSNLLKDKGAFYMSTMEDDYTKSGFKSSSSGEEKQMYIHYHQADYLTKALRENDFKIVSLQRQIYPEQKDTTAKDLIIIAIKTKHHSYE